MASPKTPPTSYQRELDAIGVVLKALEPLDPTSRQFVLRTVVERLAITGVQTSGTGGPTPPGGLATTDLSNVHPKAFIKLKKPTTDVQRVACLAFYLTHGRNLPAFKTRDITKLDTDAAAGGFTHAGAAVRNATNQSHFLASAGGAKKQITSHGEDVVNALPDQEAVKKVVAEYVPPRRHARRKKKIKP